MGFIFHILVFLVVIVIIVRLKIRNPPMHFIGQHVFITGASSGIGESLAYLFSALGAFVTIASRENEEVKLCNKS